MVRDPKSSQDEITTSVERSRYHNLGKRCRAKNLEASTYRKVIDSMLLDRTSSSSGVNAERMEVSQSLAQEMKRPYSVARGTVPKRIS